MLFDAEQREAGWFRDKIFDVCVIGSGPAGMSVALKLGQKGWNVGLFEGGGSEPTAESSEIYRGRIVGVDYYPLQVTRQRYFGGTSNHWTGWCRNLESFDFEPQEHSPYSGWPIRKADLDPYNSEAEQILDLGPPNASFDLFGEDNGSLLPFQYRWSSPTRFGEKYKDDLSASGNIQVFLNANVVDLNLADDHRQVRSAVFHSYARPEPFAVQARVFVLCLGGLENPRFLLNASRQIRVGIGNESDLVGRFFAEHMHFHVGRMILKPELQQKFPEFLFFRPKPEFLQFNQTENFMIRLDGLFHAPDSWAIALARSALCSSATLSRVAASIHGVEIACYDGPVTVMAGQVPNPQSRVRLGNDVDRFGSRRIELDWRLSELDKRTLFVAATEFGKQLARRNAGRLRIHDWVLDPTATFPKVGEDEVGGHHHMCTTRMSDDPKAGVVDRNCRVHSVENLYVGGSSVFSTPGFANPTYTIVQLALRLANHLDSRLKTAP